MAKRKISGYVMHQEVNSIHQALERGQKATREMIYDNPGPVRQSNLLAQIAMVFVEIGRALREIEKIVARNNEQ